MEHQISLFESAQAAVTQMLAPKQVIDPQHKKWDVIVRATEQLMVWQCAETLGVVLSLKRRTPL